MPGQLKLWQPARDVARWCRRQARRLRRRISPSPTASDVRVVVEQFSYFADLLILRGTVVAGASTIHAGRFEASGRTVPLKIDHPSPGAFFAHQRVPVPDGKLDRPCLVFLHDDGAETRIETLAGLGLDDEPGHKLQRAFWDRLHRTSSGTLLEIGSRARSGITRRQLVPPTWRYLGFDVIAGANVDMVGDAHFLSAQVASQSIDAMVSISVFEHLAMPWKVAIEMNKVLKLGGIAYIQSHQSYPLHDYPWDFWRFSESAWDALFNTATGFRIIAAASAEPLYMVAKRWHQVADHQLATGSALSAVLVEKIAETELFWNVDPASFVKHQYPN
jgi:hypothetical protein